MEMLVSMGWGVDMVGLVCGGSRHWRFCLRWLSGLLVWWYPRSWMRRRGREEGRRGSTYGGCRISLQLLERKATAICEAVACQPVLLLI